MQVAGRETAKEIWDSLKARFIGTEDVQQLKSEFERLVMKENETIDSFAGKLMSIITKAATCGLTFDEQTKVRKVLNAVPDKFLPIVATIEMIVDFKTVKLEEIIGKLKTYEERLKFRKGSEEDNSEKLLFTRQENDRNYERNYENDRRGGGNKTRGRGQGRFTRDSKNEDSYDKRRRNPGDQNYHRRDIREIECYNCHEFGHYAANCPKPDRREEKANLVFEDDEPTLLMVTSEDEIEITSLKEEPSVDKGECKKHRETPSRFQKESQIEKDIKSKNKKVESENRDTRNSVLEIQECETIQMKKDGDKNDQVEDQDKGSGSKPKFKDKDNGV
ncbi:zinc finger, CCHC-type containing protein [Tanacetum coccineum]|uniref:Zinc finger, CCHC-type containing protein n=1 Tax=Tanacetum coccineum TaxID=301880 RepID=A0ABQ4Y9Q1_9ASTR